MNTDSIRLLLADDDLDDCLLFNEALQELPIQTKLTTVNDGEQLMQELSGSGVLPSVLFLDLNMPRKNGFECLSEINVKESLKDLPVIIFSTSYDSEVVKKLYSDGAHFYVRKPNEFEKLKIVIQQALLLTTQPKYTRPSMENFVLNS